VIMPPPPGFVSDRLRRRSAIPPLTWRVVPCTAGVRSTDGEVELSASTAAVGAATDSTLGDATGATVGSATVLLAAAAAAATVLSLLFGVTVVVAAVEAFVGVSSAVVLKLGVRACVVASEEAAPGTDTPYMLFFRELALLPDADEEDDAFELARERPSNTTAASCSCSGCVQVWHTLFTMAPGTNKAQPTFLLPGVRGPNEGDEGTDKGLTAAVSAAGDTAGAAAASVVAAVGVAGMTVTVAEGALKVVATGALAAGDGDAAAGEEASRDTGDAAAAAGVAAAVTAEA
jgi:hypothetical protein